MGAVNETMRTVNSTLRTLLMMVLVGGAGYGGYLAYDLYNEPQQQLADKQKELDATLDELQSAQEALTQRQQEIGQLQTEVAEKEKEIERLDVAMKLLKVRRRLARLTALDQRDDPNSERPITRIEFVEVNEEGQPISEARQFDIVGDVAYVDYLHVTFDDKYVESSDLDRSTAICLFQRIFGEHQEAAQGYRLDRVGTRPTAYARGTEMSEFERQIWDDFWLIANDPRRAAELGIYAASGAAVYMKLEPGKQYELELRATGEMTMRPVESPTTETPAVEIDTDRLEPVQPADSTPAGMSPAEAPPAAAAPESFAPADGGTGAAGAADGPPTELGSINPLPGETAPANNLTPAAGGAAPPN